MRRDAPVDDKPQEGGVTEAMVNNVEKIEFSYYDPKLKEWDEVWDSTQIEKANRLPMAVKATLEIRPPDRETPLVFSTTVEIKLYSQPLSF